MSYQPGRAARQTAGGPGVTRFATRGDHRLSYESSGVADGMPVIALHDLLADRGQFRALAETLREEGFRVTLPDARGHGASPMISGRTYPAAELAADALAVLDAEGLTAAHVAAVGWGALAALGLAMIAPERVESLVLAEPNIPRLMAERADVELREESVRHMEMLREAATAAEKGQIDQALDLFLDLRLGEGWRDRLAKPRLGAIRRSAASLAPLLTGLTADPFDGEALGHVAAPVTVLLQDDASRRQRGTAELLASLLPRARIEMVPREGDAGSPPGSWWEPGIARALEARRA